MKSKTRKLMWSVPIVAAVAVIGALALFLTLDPNGASAQANVEIPPGMPVGLMADAYNEGTEQEEIQLDWTEPTDGGSARWYRIDISMNGGYTWVALESDFRGTSYTHDGLKASQTFHYRVFALNQHGISVVSDVVNGTTADSWIPDRPTDLTAKVGGSSSDPVADTVAELEITLEWDAPVNPDGAPVSGYVAQYSVDGTVWDPVPDVKKSGDKHAMLEAGVEYQYRVAAVNSVDQSGWSSTAKDETKPGAIPDAPETITPAVAPLELNTWLFWEPSDDPLGDAISGYEVVGRPIKVAGPRLFGGEPAPLADLVAVFDGPIEANDSAEPPVLNTDDNRGYITVAGIHFGPISLNAENTNNPSPDDDNTDPDFWDVAENIEDAIDELPTVSWEDATAYSHPLTLVLNEDHDNDIGTGNVNVYYSTRRDVPVTADPMVDDVADTTPHPTYWTNVGPAPALAFADADVMYIGRRFVLTIPRTGAALGKALPMPSESLASLLGWTFRKGAVSQPEFKCCPIPAMVAAPDATPPIEAAAAMPGWKVVKTDIDRPSGTDINQFLVTTADIPRGYSAQWVSNTDWEFRVRALNRRAPANATVTEVNIPADTTMTLAASWSDEMGVTPGSDRAMRRPDDLTIKRSNPDHEGRTGLILEWDKASTVADSNGDTVDAAAYQIEYSDTGLEEEGYDWRVLKDIHDPGDDADENRQMFTDNADGELGASDTLAAGQKRHYRVFALTKLTEADGIEGRTTLDVNAVDTRRVDEPGTEKSWPSPQEYGQTAAPLKPDAPQRLRVSERGHTHIALAWTAPDASNQELDGSERGSTVIIEYVIEMSNDEGVTWDDLETVKVGTTTYVDESLMPGQTRDYRVRAVNSSNTSVWSNTVDETTIEAVLPNEPGGLAAQTGDTAGSVKLCWNAQAEQPEDAPVFEYLVQYSADGETNWMDLGKVTAMADDQVHTIYTDTTLDAGETRHYRVFAINLRGQSDQSDVADASAKAATVPGAPMVSAMADSDAEITVTWTAPADGGSDITGYKVMWKMSSATEYAATDMATAAATARSHQVTGLTASTAYTFKAMAMNAKGDSMASDEAMATTYRTNTAPTADGTIADMTLTAGQMSSGMDVTGYFSDADMGDTLTYTASSNMPMYAIVAVSGNMVTVTGVAAGTATITVTATDMGVGAGMMNPMTATQTFMVTVEAAAEPMLTAPTGTTATSDAAGMVTVNWTSGDNALGHLVLLFKSDFSGDPMVGVPSGDSHTFSGVPAGSYIAVVVSYRSVSDYEYEALLSVVTVR